MTTTTIHCCLFDGVDELDVIGPYEVFNNAQRSGAAIEPTLVGIDSTEPVRANHGTVITPADTLGEPDCVVVPGGGWSDGQGGVRLQVEDGRLGERIERLHSDDTTIASVCTGAMILADAGVLDGRTATTHHTAREDLAAFDSITVSTERVVDTGDVITAGGVTAGIDMALEVVTRFANEEIAASVAHELEYDRSRQA